MLRRFSGLSCGKYCFYSLIFAFIISLGSVNIANAYVCFLPDSADCAKGDTEGFWPCLGSDCPSSNGRCDASYNSRMATNECGAACTRCADANSPYNGLYKCPKNTCNCNDYTSTEAFNECGEACEVCRISGDKNYGKYKCNPVPADGCPNPCNDCILTEAQARDKMASNPCMECEQCANLNCTDAQQSKWHCSENKLCKQCQTEGYNKDENSSEYIDSQQTCSKWSCEPCPYNDSSEQWFKCMEDTAECGIEYSVGPTSYQQMSTTIRNNHCYDKCEICYDKLFNYWRCDNCFGYEYTMQDCQNAGYDSAKNPCPTLGKRGTVYQTCCNTCNGYIYSTDLSKTSEGWECGPACTNSCDGGSKYSCSCKTGYHSEGGNCVKDVSNQDYTPCDNGIWYAGNCVRYFHLRMDSDLHCYKSVYSKNIKVDGNAAHISDIDADWAVIPEGTMVTVDFEMLDQYKDLYSEDVCKNNGMIMRGHNFLTGSELDLNSKLTVFLAQSKISFIADDSHFNYVDTIPWNNDRDEILLDLYDNDYPDSGSSSIPEVTICLEEFFDGDQGEVGDGYVLCGYSLTRYVDEDNSGDFEKLLAAGYSFDLNLNIGDIGYWVDGKHYFDNNVYGYYCDFVLTKARVGCLNNTVGWPCLEDYAHSNNRSKDCDENPELCYGCGSSYLCYGSNNFPTDFPSLQSTGTYLEITGPDVSKSLNLGACHHIPSQNVNVCFELY